MSDRMDEANQSVPQEPPPVQPINGVILTLARHRARKEVKAQLLRLGLRPTHTDMREIEIEARAYLASHVEELIKEAQEVVRIRPRLRTLAKQMERYRQGKQR